MEKRIYKIWCEWDMGFDDVYETKELAQKAINEMDWETLTELTLKEVQTEGFVFIEECKIITK